MKQPSFTPSERRELLVFLRPKLIERAKRHAALDRSLTRREKQGA